MLIKVSTSISFLIVFFTCGLCFAQNKGITPDLSKVSSGDSWKISNRKVELIDESGVTSVHFNSQPGDGIAWIDNFVFNTGIIEVDIKGKNEQGASFVGIAFRGINEKTYDAVYFRPFNFMSMDSVKKDHCVQYVSQPDYTWQRLREEFPGKYENPVNPIPDPNSFFHARIVVEKPKISVYVNDADMPCLVVNELTNRNGGWIGLWTGNYSEGWFTNLKIFTSGDE